MEPNKDYNVMVKTRKGPAKHFPYTPEGIKAAQGYAKKYRNTVQSTRIYKK